MPMISAPDRPSVPLLMKRTRILFLGASLLAGTAAGIGCGSLPSPDLFARDDVKALVRTRGEPIPMRLGVAGLSPASAPAEGTAGPMAWRVSVKTDVVRDEVASAIKKAGLFADVQVLRDVDAGSKPADAAAAADRAGLDLVLTVTPGEQKVAYMGRAGSVYLNVPIWLLFGWPSIFLADENYSMESAYAVGVLEARTGKPLWDSELEGRVECALSDLQRGLNFWSDAVLGLSMIAHSSFVGETNFKAAAETLGIHARNEATATLLKQVSGPLREGLTRGAYADVLGAAPARLYAVVAGVGRTMAKADEIPPLKQAEGDAKAVWDWLVSSGGPGMRADDGALLLGKDATRAKLLDALKRVAARRPRESDVVFVYVASYGAAEDRSGAPKGDPREAVLFAHDSNVKDLLGTGLPVAEIEKALSGLPGTVVVLLDAGFGVKTGARSLGAPGEAGTPVGASAAAANRPGFVVLLGSGRDGEAGEDEDAGHGAFTTALLKGLAGAADGNRDGKVTAAELLEQTVSEVESWASVSGANQKPELLCGDAGRAVFPPKGGGRGN